MTVARTLWYSVPMIINFVGPREPGNHFKKKVAETFKCPVLSFNDLSAQLFGELNEIYGVKDFSLRALDDAHLVLRDKITHYHPKFYMDWMSEQLVKNVFNRKPSQPRVVQAVILDVETDWEYRVLRTYLLSPKNKKANKVLLVENDDVKFNWYNKNKDQYLNWEVDGVTSKDDEDWVKDLERIQKTWYTIPKELQ